MKRNCLYAALSILIPILSAHAQDFPAVPNTDTDRDASPMPANEAASSFQVPEGFSVQVFAQEPDVQNPIDMTWDSQGRMWIAENYTYAERSQRFDLNLRDRVVILADADGDGVAEDRKVFTDQVQMLTSVEVGRGGVWLMCPPQLLFIPDEDGDDRPDGPAQVVVDGFEVAQENYHNFANGLRWGPDGWLYGRCGGSCPGEIGIPGTPDDQRIPLRGGIWRYHPTSKQVEVLTHGTTNPWGHDWNEFGECFFINTVNGHLWHMIPGAHFDRPFTLDPNPHVYELLDMHADHWHFDTDGSWTDSRDGSANSFGGGHAHVGMMIYLGDNWPDAYRGRLLTFNIHGRRLNQEVLHRDGSGYVATHGDDLLLSADPFFRGMELSYGPDGAVYAIDWSDTGECHEHTGVHRTSGRVFRIAFPENKSQSAMDLRSLGSSRLVSLMETRNEWYVRQARIVLAERSDRAKSSDGSLQSDAQSISAATSQLHDLVAGDDGLIAYRALMTLQAMQAADPGLVRSQLDHSNEHMRACAVRLLTDTFPLDDVYGRNELSADRLARITNEYHALEEVFCAMALSDESGLVRLTLASTLQRLPVTHRAKLASSLMRRTEDADDPNLPLMVWYGLMPLAEVEPMALAEVAIDSKWPKTQRLIARRLAHQVGIHPGAIETILAFLVSTDDPSIVDNLLSGISDGLKGWRRAPKPNNWSQVVNSHSDADNDSTVAMIRDLSVLFGDGRALDEIREIVLDENSEIGVRRSALETLVANGGEDVTDICLSLLADGRLNMVAAAGLSRSSDPMVARALIDNYRRFRGPQRPRVIAILVSRRSFAAELLDAIAANQIPASDLTAFDVRQIGSIGDDSLQSRVSKLWGEVRESTEAKRERIDEIRRDFTSTDVALANLSQGRSMFDQNCSKCHKLFGQGEEIAPDLTGANRTNIDYLLENIVDPSAVVSKDFRMTIVETVDGQILNGLVVSRNERTLTLQTQTELRVIDLDDVVQTQLTTESPMPDGLMDNLSPQQVRDLIAYLMHASQVPLPEAGPKNP